MNIKRNILFVPDKEPGRADGKLRCRVSWDGNKVAFGVGFRVDFDKWSKDTQRCKNSTTHGKDKVQANVINREIQRFDTIIESIFTGYEKDNKIPTANEFRNDFNVAIGKAKKEVEKTVSFFDVFDEFIDKESSLNSWSYSMIQKFGTFKNHLLEFRKDLSFQELTTVLLTDFVAYEHTRGLYNTSIDKDIRYLRWFLRWAANNGYYSGRLHETFRPRLKGTDGSNRDVIHLTWDELMQLYEFDIDNAEKRLQSGELIPLRTEQKEALKHVRDVFCFCCFTGLRYSDAAKLTKYDIRDGCIHIVTQKTTDALKIELNNFSKAILDKYASVALPKNLALPVISNQKMNDQLKVLCELVGFDTPQRIVYYKGSQRYEDVFPKYAVISTHTGRRTFIVNALYLGISSEVVMKWTGHKTYASMKPYMKIVDDLKAREMDKFNQLVPGVKKGD
jgi:integrase